MIKTLLISTSMLFSASVGVWINTDGYRQTVPCPTAFTDTRMRLPQGCMAVKHGVWLSTGRYRDMEVELAGLRERVKAKDIEIDAYKDRVNGLTSQLLVCTAVPECPACPDYFLKHTATGAAIASVITLGGCAAWTLSQ